MECGTKRICVHTQIVGVANVSLSSQPASKPGYAWMAFAFRACVCVFFVYCMRAPEFRCVYTLRPFSHPAFSSPPQISYRETPFINLPPGFRRVFSLAVKCAENICAYTKAYLLRHFSQKENGAVWFMFSAIFKLCMCYYFCTCARRSVCV